MSRCFQHNRALIVSLFLLLRPQLGLCGVPLVSVLETPTQLPPEGAFTGTVSGLPFPLETSPAPEQEQFFDGVLSSLKAIHNSLLRLEGAFFAPPRACGDAGAPCNQTMTRPFNQGHHPHRPGLRRQILSVDASVISEDNATLFAWDKPENETEITQEPASEYGESNDGGFVDDAPDDELPSIFP